MPVYIITSTWEKEISIEADSEWQAMEIAEELLKPNPRPPGCVYYKETSSFPFHGVVVSQLLQCPYCSNNYPLRTDRIIVGCFVRCPRCKQEARLESLTKGRNCSMCDKSLNCLSRASVIECPGNIL
jgi:hypothetical protein